MAIDLFHVDFNRVPAYRHWPLVGWHVIPANRWDSPILPIENAVRVIVDKFMSNENWQERFNIDGSEFEIQNIVKNCIKIINYEIGLYVQIPDWLCTWSSLSDFTNDLIFICKYFPIIAVHES